MDDHAPKPLARASLEALLSKWSRVSTRRAAEVPEAHPVERVGVHTDPARVAALAELSPEDPDGFLERMVSLFAKTGQEHVTAMWSALRDRRLDELAVRAHTLKSSAQQFGAEALALLCKEVELGARAGEVEPVETKLAALEAELRGVIEELSS
jgi:HPt (histidine-containing phosphotransfer) domain-containing protein